jgi:hypothetical protein
LPAELGLFPPSWLSLLSGGLLSWQRVDTSWPAHETFISFEDALWAFLDASPLASRTILVPDFFCTDVTSRLSERGYTIIWYALNPDLTFHEASFLAAAQGPIGAVFLYYPMGARATTPPPSWFRSHLGNQTLIIEDAADCLLEPGQVQLIDEAHIVIDSLRKILPLQGARLFHRLNTHIAKSSRMSLYHLKTHVLHFAYHLLHSVTELLPLSSLLHAKWHIFVMHSDLIGTEPQGAVALTSSLFLYNRCNITLWKQRRAALMHRYYERVAPALHDTGYQLIAAGHNEASEVRFPILMGKKGSLTALADALEQARIYVDIHFDDSPRAREADYLLLPLSPCMREADIDTIAAAIMNLLNKHHS